MVAACENLYDPLMCRWKDLRQAHTYCIILQILNMLIGTHLALGDITATGVALRGKSQDQQKMIIQFR